MIGTIFMYRNPERLQQGGDIPYIFLFFLFLWCIGRRKSILTCFIFHLCYFFFICRTSGFRKFLTVGSNPDNSCLYVKTLLRIQFEVTQSCVFLFWLSDQLSNLDTHTAFFDFVYFICFGFINLVPMVLFWAGMKYALACFSQKFFYIATAICFVFFF